MQGYVEKCMSKRDVWKRLKALIKGGLVLGMRQFLQFTQLLSLEI